MPNLTEYAPCRSSSCEKLFLRETFSQASDPHLIARRVEMEREQNDPFEVEETSSTLQMGGQVLEVVRPPDDGDLKTNITVETARAELSAIEVALRTALGHPMRLSEEDNRKNTTIQLLAELIAREDELRRVQSLSTRGAHRGAHPAGTRAEHAESDQEDRPWGTPTKAAVERFAEELEVVLKEKELAEQGVKSATRQRREAVLAYEKQRARAAESEKALHFAQGEIGRLAKKVDDLNTLNRGLRSEVALQREKLKQLEKQLALAQTRDKDAQQAIIALKKDVQADQQILKSKNLEIQRLQLHLGEVTSKKESNCRTIDEQNLKRISDLEEKVVQLAFATSRAPDGTTNTSQNEVDLIVQELAREELKSRARAAAAEKVASELRVELDAKTTELVVLRRKVVVLEPSPSLRQYDSDRSQRLHDGATVSVEHVERSLQASCDRAENLCRRLSTVVNSVVERSPFGSTLDFPSDSPLRESQGFIKTPASITSNRSEGRIRDLEVALEQQQVRLGSAEKLAEKASGEAAALRKALINAENIALAAASVAESKGLTGAYIARSHMEDSPSHSPQHSVSRTKPFSELMTPKRPLVNAAKELDEARRVAMEEKRYREEAEETLRRWSKLQE